MKNVFRLYHAVALLALLSGYAAHAQVTAPPQGIRENPHRCYAFTHATLIPSPGKKLEDATLVIRDGRIVLAGIGVTPPADALVRDLKGAYVYPGLIDAWTGYGVVQPEPKSEGNSGPQYLTEKTAPVSWNQAVRPEYSAAESFRPDPKKAEALRASGFSLVHCVPGDGIFRGTSFISLLNDEPAALQVMRPEAGTCMSFEKGTSRQAYPSSLMGAIALIRQTWLDAKWYSSVRTTSSKNASDPAAETNISLEALNRQDASGMPAFFEVKDWQNLLRADRMAREFNRNFIYRTAGDEYQRAEAVAAIRPKLIVPLNFPKAIEVRDPADAREVPLSRLRSWIQAPGNPAVLESKQIAFAFTTSGLDKPEDVFAAVRKAMAYGLSETGALAAFTTVPAGFLGISDLAGTIEPGKLASFIICSDSLFSKNNVIWETWTQGKGFVIRNRPLTDLRGRWEGKWNNETIRISISGKPHELSGETTLGSDTTRLKSEVQLDRLNVSVNWKEGGNTGNWIRFSGVAKENEISGQAILADGSTAPLTLLKAAPKPDEKKDPANEFTRPSFISPVTLPNLSYGNLRIPAAETVHLKNVTLWTNTPEGKIENGEIIFTNGKITRVGKRLNTPSGATIIDGGGKHVTPGIIDEHSHIAISQGVNEGSHSVTSEVRIGDVVNCEDVNIYRQLAGGVTTSHLLHGSANSIGGQTILVKLRWGMTPEQMKFEGAPGYIKFALGENVKQSNWGEQFSTRYPQTRLGVEQVIRDAFTAAKEYQRKLSSGENVRRNLQLDALVEIMEKQRFITCHSYVQSEIVMLMRLAESFGFRVNTFTHILEGYKVADKLKSHGANASTFSDWWAYKYEVIDAIPYNAALLNEKGVNVCINSDDAEMGRRLNEEAAKCVKYGGMSEEDALKTVTLNPAKALRVDNRVGALKEGMDADIVLWSGHPLSVYSFAEKTWVDGRRMFDREQDDKMREDNEKERAKLIQMMIASPDPAKAPAAAGKENRLYECETLESDYNE